MKLIPNARGVLLRSLALWCVYLSGLCEVLPYMVPYLDGYIPSWLSTVFIALSPIGRVIDQGFSNGR